MIKTSKKPDEPFIIHPQHPHRPGAHRAVQLYEYTPRNQHLELGFMTYAESSTSDHSKKEKLQLLAIQID